MRFGLIAVTWRISDGAVVDGNHKIRAEATEIRDSYLERFLS